MLVRPSVLVSLLLGLTALRGSGQGMTEFLRAKQGFLASYVWPGDPAKPYTIDALGKRPQTFEAFAAAFDAEGFASDMEKWGMEYVIFTAWHFNLNPLFPSETMKKWGLENHRCTRDLLRELIDCCKAKGIKVMLYTHPRDGHDLSLDDQLKTGWGGPNGHDPQWEHFDFNKWNDFTAELYQELITRYGADLMGVMIDEGSVNGDSDRVVDYPRLRRLLKAQRPELVIQHNFFGNHYLMDVGAKEFRHSNAAGDCECKQVPSSKMPVMINFSTSWWAIEPAGKNVVSCSAEDLFRQWVVQAGTNDQGGGVQWSAGNYVGGGWETGVAETMTQLANFARPIAPAIKQTLASTSYPTAAGTRLADLTWGVATRAPDDSRDYLHILKPPIDGATACQLPPPADGKRFQSATLLTTGAPVDFKQTAAGITLKLPVGATWNALDTVIVLQTAADSPLQNLARWKAFQASSVADPANSNKLANSFSAVDGDLTTAWVSRADGLSAQHQPAPADPQPWCQIDLGNLADLSRLELVGELGPNLAIAISAQPDFKSATVVARRNKAIDHSVQAWSIKLPANSTARYIRLSRTRDGPPLKLTEFRVFGKFR